jgi:hypothetical protein
MELGPVEDKLLGQVGEAARVAHAALFHQELQEGRIAEEAAMALPESGIHLPSACAIGPELTLGHVPVRR